MASLQTKKNIGNFLYITAIILLLISIYYKGQGVTDHFTHTAGFVALGIAAIYGIWFSKQNKKEEG